MATRYNPNPTPITEPLFTINSIEELERSPLYRVTSNGTAAIAYHTDSFDYVVPVVEAGKPIEITIEGNRQFQNLVIRHSQLKSKQQISVNTVTVTYQ